MCPYGGRLTFGADPRSEPAKLVCHCLLVETDRDGLLMVDTGLGMGDVEAPRVRLHGFFRNAMRLPLRREETAIEQIRQRGFRPQDVRHIVLTHLDFDHAGGLEDFPEATVHLLEAERAAASGPRVGLVARGRYRPLQWDGVKHWETYRPEGEAWFGFASVRDLRGLPPEILLIPLVGHTWGHAGIAIHADGGWLLHAGDAYFHATEMDWANPRCPPALRLYQRLMEVDRRARLANQERLRELVRTQGEAVRVFSAHDAGEFARTCAETQRPGDAERSEPRQPKKERATPAGTSFRSPKGKRQPGTSTQAKRIVELGASGPAPAELNPGSSATDSVARAPEND